jgi:hypothetical protein
LIDLPPSTIRIKDNLLNINNGYHLHPYKRSMFTIIKYKNGGCPFSSNTVRYPGKTLMKSVKQINSVIIYDIK